MALQPLLREPQLSDEQSRLRHIFFEESGYGPSDLLSLNYDTRTFMTRNGGIYRVTEDGSIDHISGPSLDLFDRL